MIKLALSVETTLEEAMAFRDLGYLLVCGGIEFNIETQVWEAIFRRATTKDV